MVAYPSLQPKVNRTLFYDNEFLNFEDDNRVQELTLEKLKRTQHELDGRTNTPMNGIHHDDLIETIMEIAQEEGYDVEITGLFAAQNKERKLPGVSVISELSREYGPRSVESHILRRIFVNLKLTPHDFFLETDKYELCLAVAYHQKGIQVGFGTKVRFCQNQMLLNADCYIATYSDERMRGKEVSLEELFRTIRFWLRNAESILNKEQAILERWKSQLINYSQLIFVLGTFLEMRVRADSSKLEKKYKGYPLGQKQISDLSEELLYRLENSENHKISLWDIYDVATNLYKPWLMPEFPNILAQNREMCWIIGKIEETFVSSEVVLPQPPKELSDNDLQVLRQKLKDKILRDIDLICKRVENNPEILENEIF